MEFLDDIYIKTVNEVDYSVNGFSFNKEMDEFSVVEIPSNSNDPTKYLLSADCGYFCHGPVAAKTFLRWTREYGPIKVGE